MIHCGRSMVGQMDYIFLPMEPTIDIDWATEAGFKTFPILDATRVPVENGAVSRMKRPHLLVFKEQQTQAKEINKFRLNKAVHKF